MTEYFFDSDEREGEEPDLTIGTGAGGGGDEPGDQPVRDDGGGDDQDKRDDGGGGDEPSDNVGTYVGGGDD